MLNHSLALLLADSVPVQPDAGEPPQHGRNEEKIVSTHTDFRLIPAHARMMQLCLDYHTHTYSQKRQQKKKCKSTYTGQINTAVRMANSAGFGQVIQFIGSATLNGAECWICWALWHTHMRTHMRAHTHTHQPTEPQRMTLYPLWRSALSARETCENESGEREDKV